MAPGKQHLFVLIPPLQEAEALADKGSSQIFLLYWCKQNWKFFELAVVDHEWRRLLGSTAGKVRSGGSATAEQLVTSIYSIGIHQLGKHGFIVNNLAVERFVLSLKEKR